VKTMLSFLTRDWEIKLRPSSRPEILVVEVATTCNLNCIHCFRKSAYNMKPCVMNLEVFEKLLDNALDAGVSKIVFSGWGEPFTNPHIRHMIKFCKNLGLKVAVNTNGTLIEKFFDIVVECVDELYLSLDAATVRTYSSVRRSTAFNEVVGSLVKLVNNKRVRGSLKPVVKAIFTITRINMNEVSEFLELVSKIGINEAVFTHTIPHSQLMHAECVDFEKCIEEFHFKLKDALSSIKELGVTVTAPRKLGSTPLSCPFAEKRALFIRCDGAIAPCIYYAYTWSPRILSITRTIKEVVLGDVSRDKLIEVWRNAYSKMLFKLYFKKMPSCLTCTLVNYCSRTRSNEADCLGNAPTCGQCPYLHGLAFCPL